MRLSEEITAFFDRIAGRETIKDDRLHPKPSLKRYGYMGGQLRLSMKVMTPLRLSLLHEVIFFPMLIVVSVAIALTIFDAMLDAVGIRFVFAQLPFSRTAFLFGLLWMCICCLSEAFSRYPILKFFFGLRITISINQNSVHVSGEVDEQRFDRSHHVAFSRVPFVHSTSLIYRNSQALYLIVGETRRIRIAEVFDLQLLEELVNNANVALFLSQQQNDLDIDPMRRHRPNWNEPGLPYIPPPSYPPIESTAAEVEPKHAEPVAVAETSEQRAQKIRELIQSRLKSYNESQSSS